MRLSPTSAPSALVALLPVLLFVLLPVLLGAACAPAAAPRGPAAVPADTLADAVVREFLHAWRGYGAHAWGHDGLQPVSATPYDWYETTFYISAVDALDTMLLMGLDEEAAATRDFIATHLSFDRDVYVKHFEFTIRLLGGLLSGYQMTGDRRLLDLAEDLGTRMLPAFDSPTGMPYVEINLRTGAVRGTTSNPAEIGTLLVEYGTLGRLTGNDAFYDAAKRALVRLYERRSAAGLVGQGIDVTTGAWTNSSSHLGAGIDSYYEYLLKCAVLFEDPECRAMWEASAQAVHTYLADTTATGLWYGRADMETGLRTETIYGALDAFFPAVLALAGDMDRAARLQEAGFAMWNENHVEPERFDYVRMEAVAPRFFLNPEIIESAYYLYHYTGDGRYREMGRTIFEDLRRCCRTPHGYTALQSVVTKAQADRMESYFFSETMKYLYLLFAPPGRLDFDAVVFTTNGHPIRKTWP